MDKLRHSFTSALASGSVLSDRYEVVRPLGEGGMGVVVLARDRLNDNQDIALKFLRPEVAKKESTLRRFKREVEICRSLTHPNIVRIHELEETDTGIHFMTMEYVPGKSLAAATREGDPLPLETVFDYIVPICCALDYAHRKGVVHRDIKPDNILIDENGVTKLADFGLARLFDIDSQLTATGEAIGTPYYMAPEQLRGAAVDARTDIYSLGIMLFELLTGERPFDDDVYLKLATRHITNAFPSARERNAELPAWVDRVTRECCEKEPRDRFQSLAELAAYLAPRLSGDSEQRISAIAAEPTFLGKFLNRFF